MLRQVYHLRIHHRCLVVMPIFDRHSHLSMLCLWAWQCFSLFQLDGHFCARLEHDTGAAIVVMSTKFISLIAAVLVKHMLLLIIILNLAVVVVMISTVLGRLTRFTRLSMVVLFNI